MAASAVTTTSFLGTRLPEPKQPGSGKFKALFSFVTKKKPSPPAKKSPKPVSDDRPVWYPGAKAPEWLDGSMVGDRGFDPFGLAKPAEYLQFDYDELDQNLAKNNPGEIIGIRVEDSQVNPTPFQPYTEVFGIQRFRECEVIHGRWAMLATLGAIAVEALTGVAWQDAGKVELIEGSSYLGLKLPFSLTALIWIEVLLVGYIEFQRNAELDPEARLYPGGKYFDPLGLAEDPEKKLKLQLAEIKHSRLAMVAFLGFAIQAAATGQGPLSNAAAFLSDPSNNILKTLS
ncbi:hypothetical protein V2J09_009957 [Rumex salicifolius]